MSEEWNPWVRDALRRHEELRSGPSASRVGRFLLSSVLGEGGMGVVWLARDPQLGRDVALKVLRPRGPGDRALLERFHREAQNAAKLQHPNIVTVYEAGQAGETFYIAMELIRGQPLSAWREGRSRPLQAVLRLVEQAARGVQAAHDHGVVHRDLKPGNIMVDAQAQPHIVDFGLSRAIETDHTVTRTGAVIGSPCYMSPEQVRGETRRVGPLTDVYALGVVLYEVLSGRVPFEGDSVASVFEGILARDPPPLAGVPAPVAAICARAMEKEPGRRYPSAGAFADDLRRYLAGEAVSARPMSTARRFARMAWRRRAILLPAAGLGALAIGLLWAWSGRAGTEQARRDLEREQAELRRRARAREEADRRFDAARTALEAALRYARGAKSDDGVVREQVEKACALLREGLEHDPDRASGHYLLGCAAEALCDYAAADGHWRRAIEKDRRFGPAHFQRARLLVMRSFLASMGISEEDRAARRGPAEELAREAERELQAAMETASGFDDELLREVARGMLAYVRGDPAARHVAEDALVRFGGREGVEEAHFLDALTLVGQPQIEAFGRVLQERPRHALALLCRATKRHDGGDPDGAIADFTESIRHNPREPRAFIGRGGAYRAKRDLARARADYEEAARLDPSDAVPHRNLGTVLEAMGDADGAIAALSEAVRVNPREWQALSNRALLRFRRREFDAAIEDYTRVIEIAPSFDAYSNRGIARYRKGDLDGSIADFSECVRIAPERADGWWQRSIARRDKGDPGVIGDYDKVLAIDPSNVTAWYDRAHTRQAQGDLKGALADYTEAIRRKPEYVGALVNRGNVKLALQDADGAVADCDAALKIDARFVPALFNRGVAHYVKERYDRALADFKRCVELAPRDAGAHYYLGRAHAARRELAEAEAALVRALELGEPGWADRGWAEKVLAEVRAARPK